MSVTGQVLEAIADYVARQGIMPGERLPTERELAERLRVSRPSVREALKHWEALGVVERRQGSGTFLRFPLERGSTPITLMVNLEREALLRIHELRRALEPEAAALAALRATPEDLEILEDKLHKMEEVRTRYGRAPEEDWEFHLAVYRCAHNPLFEQIFLNLHTLFHRFFEKPLGISEFSKRSFELHRELYTAITQRQPETARSTAQKILLITEEDLEQGASNRGI